MDIQLINGELLDHLRGLAADNERRRVNFDLRTTEEDSSQRMLNVMESGTRVDIHQHWDTAETIVCLEGHVEVVLYAELPNMDAGGPGRDLREVARVTLCPAERRHGVQVPPATWHTVEVVEPSVIFEAKDGKFVADKPE